MPRRTASSSSTRRTQVVVSLGVLTVLRLAWMLIECPGYRARRLISLRKPPRLLGPGGCEGHTQHTRQSVRLEMREYP